MKSQYSSDTWTVEPFDAERDLWSLGRGSDFIWMLLAADPEGERHRSIPREEGVSEIQARRGKNVIGGRVQRAEPKPRRRKANESGRLT